MESSSHCYSILVGEFFLVGLQVHFLVYFHVIDETFLQYWYLWTMCFCLTGPGCGSRKLVVSLAFSLVFSVCARGIRFFDTSRGGVYEYSTSIYR